MQHEELPVRGVLFDPRVFCEYVSGDPGGVMFVGLLFLCQIREETTNRHVLGALRSPDVDTLGLQFHLLDFPADCIERQVLGQPDRSPFQEALDVFTPGRRQVGSKALFV